MARTIAKDHDQKRQSILKTAAGFFAARGYDRASMSDLAQACGVSKALIYHYHTSKDALLFDILHDHLGQIITAIAAVDQDHSTANASGLSSPEDILRARVDALLTCYRGADDEHRLQLSAMEALPDDQRTTLRDMQRRIVKYFADDITRINPAFTKDKADLLTPVTMSLFGMLNWFYMWHQPEKGATGNSPRGITRSGYADLATNILLGGLNRIS